MDNKIYLITQGMYDNYRVIGYCQTETEAKLLIENHNKGKVYDKYDYEECERMSNER